MTTIKPKKPLADMIPEVQNTENNNMTVEEYLNQQFDLIINDLRSHSANLIANFRSEYKEGTLAIKDLLDSTSSKTRKLCVTLKCVGGSHTGQKFRLEPSSNKSEDIFKIGRSTGRLFKEKGVSLYKDKEISTTHAKVEIRNGQVFLIDVKSTNGTQLNGDIVEAQVPIRLRENDVITMGSTDLKVHISDLNDLDTNEDNNDNNNDGAAVGIDESNTGSTHNEISV